MLLFADAAVCRCCCLTGGVTMENDYDNTDYKCYLLGCRSAGIEPDRLQRFRLQQEAYLRRTAEAGQDPRGHSVPEVVLEQLAMLVAEGYKIAAGGRRAR